jgi:hypothetical protein
MKTARQSMVHVRTLGFVGVSALITSLLACAHGIDAEPEPDRLSAAGNSGGGRETMAGNGGGSGAPSVGGSGTAESDAVSGGSGGQAADDGGPSNDGEGSDSSDLRDTGAGGAGGGTGGAGGSSGRIDAGPTAFLETNNQVSLEAEHFTDSAPGSGAAAGVTWMTVTSPAGLSGTAEQAQPLSPVVNVADSTMGPRLDFKIKFANTGTFLVWIRMHGDTDKADSVHVALGTAAPVTYGGRGMSDHSAGWAWVNAVDGIADGGLASVKVAVSSTGYNTLHVYMREAGVYVDKIVLNQSATAPTGSGPNESSRE